MTTEATPAATAPTAGAPPPTDAPPPPATQTPLSPATETPPPPATGERPAWLPEKFATGEDLAKSYTELNGLLGKRVTELPEEHRKLLADALRPQFEETLGKELRERLAGDPEFLDPLKAKLLDEVRPAVERYELAPDVLPERIALDPESDLFKSVHEIAVKDRWSPETFNAVMRLGGTLAADLLPKTLDERLAEAPADLKPRAQVMVNKARALAGPANRGAVDALLGQVMTAEGVAGLEAVLAGTGERPLPGGDPVPAEAVTKESLEAMMRDPRYWRNQDPALVAKVTEGFRRLYAPTL